MAPKICSRASRIVAAGKLRYGDTRRRSPLARLTELLQALLQMLADGSRSVTDGIEARVVDALGNEIERLGCSRDFATCRIALLQLLQLADFSSD